MLLYPTCIADLACLTEKATMPDPWWGKKHQTHFPLLYFGKFLRWRYSMREYLALKIFVRSKRLWQCMVFKIINDENFCGINFHCFTRLWKHSNNENFFIYGTYYNSLNFVVLVAKIGVIMFQGLLCLRKYLTKITMGRPYFRRSRYKLSHFMPDYVRDKVKSEPIGQLLERSYEEYYTHFSSKPVEVVRSKYIVLYEQERLCGLHIYHAKVFFKTWFIC